MIRHLLVGPVVELEMFAFNLSAEPKYMGRRAARRGLFEDLVEDLQRTTASTMKFSEMSRTNRRWACA